MLYAIATHSLLMVVEFDNNWRITKNRVLSRGYHFGVAPRETLDGGQLVAYRGGDDVHSQTDIQLLTFQVDDDLALVDTQPLRQGWGDIHQIACANGGLYIANTKFNKLVFKSFDGDQHDEYLFENRTDDWNHLNSVYPCGRQVFVILHNRSRKESQLAILNHHRSNGFQLQRALSLWNIGCHNIFIDDTHLIYNASQAHQLVIVDLRQDQIIKRVSFDGWHSKGLSVTQKHIVVGLSEHTVRDNRSMAQGKLAVLDRHSLAITTMVDLDLPFLSHGVGNINEIRALGEIDFAHRRPDELKLDWSRVRLARRRALRHHISQIGTKTLLPIRRVKQAVVKRIS